MNIVCSWQEVILHWHSPAMMCWGVVLLMNNERSAMQPRKRQTETLRIKLIDQSAGWSVSASCAKFCVSLCPG